jgi:hypothetical protein
MSCFSSEGLEELWKARIGVAAETLRLIEAFTVCELKSPDAQEHACQGFGRRMKTLARCIENVFSILPPEQSDIPDTDTLSDAAINYQTFLFNIFGSIDNLAWIWVYEKPVMRADGARLPAAWIGLGPKNTDVRRSLSASFQAYLATRADWFEYLEDYRHALAHRIPLYIPPYTVPIKNEAAYRELGARMTAALAQRNGKEYDRLALEQKALGVFTPLVMHSFGEGARPITLHPQMIADFNTVAEMASTMLHELKGMSGLPREAS